MLACHFLFSKHKCLYPWGPGGAVRRALVAYEVWSSTPLLVCSRLLGEHLPPGAQRNQSGPALRIPLVLPKKKHKCLYWHFIKHHMAFFSLLYSCNLFLQLQYCNDKLLIYIWQLRLIGINWKIKGQQIGSLPHQFTFQCINT